MNKFLFNKQWIACFFAALMLMTASTLQAQEPAEAATAISVRGLVTATDNAGEVRILRRGDKVFSGETLNTAPRSRLRLSFTDGSTTVLKASTSFEITDYNFSGQEDGSEKASFRLFQGAMEAISGLIGKKNKNSYSLNTPLATIGLRGTAFSLAVYPPTEPGGKPTIRLSTSDGTVVFSSPGAPPLAVAQGNSVSKTGDNATQTSNQVIEPMVTISIEGEELLEVIEAEYTFEVTYGDLPEDDGLIDLYQDTMLDQFGENVEILDINSINSGSDNTGSTDSGSDSTDGSTDDSTDESTNDSTNDSATSSVVDPELVDEVIENIIQNADLTDEEAEQLRNDVEEALEQITGEVVSVSTTNDNPSMQ